MRCLRSRQIHLRAPRAPEAAALDSAVEADREAVCDYLACRVDRAKGVFEALREGDLSAETQAIKEALFLARVDVIYRAGYLDACDDFFEDTRGFRFLRTPWGDEDLLVEDLAELLRMLELQLEDLASENPARLDLNPVFQPYSHYVNGADADAVIGNLLVDWKTTKNMKFSTAEFGQVLAYAAMANALGLGVERVGIYFARFGRIAIVPLVELSEGVLANFLDRLCDLGETES